jgi:hypothetical protein
MHDRTTLGFYTWPVLAVDHARQFGGGAADHVNAIFVAGHESQITYSNVSGIAIPMPDHNRQQEFLCRPSEAVTN